MENKNSAGRKDRGKEKKENGKEAGFDRNPEGIHPFRRVGNEKRSQNLKCQAIAREYLCGQEENI